MANIVVCADGTWNRPEEDIEKDFPTNVLKLARAISPSTSALKQQVFYDWGLGSYHDRVSAGATGRGIHKNILDGYRYIVQNYAEGDRIYLFGFSRGAYTVRALSGLINNCGILKRPQAALISSAWKIYKSPQKKNHPDGDAAVQFRNAHAHPSRAVHFIGVWDTVGALGLPFSFMGLFERHDEFYDTKMGPNVAYARHALAIDEQREAVVVAAVRRATVRDLDVHDAAPVRRVARRARQAGREQPYAVVQKPHGRWRWKAVKL